LITDNSKIGPWNRDLLDVQFKCHSSFFLGISATARSLEDETPNGERNANRNLE